ncbi:MAG: bifunctional folylpolyglutamate synthase/dihydrofolate synthase [Rhodospirillales bacterium]|nr:bifunctional folylpolyglutamate synthase/dihydrofolate synthase [Rhodospirillales bacterium]
MKPGKSLPVTAKSDAALKRLTKLHPKVIDLSLGRIEGLLKKLGNPHHSLPPVIHIAGTNGKGSTLAFLRSLFEAADYQVHAYTSPHLVHFHERIRVAGELVSEKELSQLLEDCEQANGDDPITFFEVTTAAAFLAFSHKPANVVLLETGLGGRLDATNLISKPALTVLTPIALDHQSFLGDTLAEIAGEKAGILKPGVPCICAKQPEEAMAVITKKAAEVGAPLIVEGKDWNIIPTPEGFTYRATEGTLSCPKPGLVGDHQYNNAGLAVACVDALFERYSITDEAVEQGIKNVSWLARLQRLTKGPLVKDLPDEWELWLDGGHNPAAGEILANQCAQWTDKPLHIICGMLNTKSPEGFLEPLVPYVKSFQTISIPGEPNTLTAEETAMAAEQVGITASQASDVQDAIQNISKQLPARILICGSLYLAGKVLAL